MRHMLTAKELWDFVTGRLVLGQAADQATTADFNRKKRLALSTIVLAIDPSMLYLVTSATEPKAAWEALKNHFDRNTLANKLFLKKSYFRAEMN